MSFTSGFIHAQTSVQILLGTQGFGLDINKSVSEKFSTRLGISSIPFSIDNIVVNFHNVNTNDNIKANFSNIHFMLNYTPFFKDNFRVVGGVAYIIKANGKANIVPTDSYSYGNIQLTKEELGTAVMNVSWSGLVPYLGVGLLNGFPTRYFNVSVDLGTYYLGSPKANMYGTGLLSGSYIYTEQLQKNVKGYKWMPLLQVNFNFNFRANSTY